MKNQGIIEGTVADILDSAPTETSDYNEIQLSAPTIKSAKKSVSRNKSVIPKIRNSSNDSRENDFELPSIYQNTRNQMMTKII